VDGIEVRMDEVPPAKDDPLRVGAVVYEYMTPNLIGRVEEIEEETAGPFRGCVKFALVRWINGDSGRVSLNAGPGRNWCSPLFLRVADPVTALTLIA
jgi:hypothetical protein